MFRTNIQGKGREDDRKQVGNMQSNETWKTSGLRASEVMERATKGKTWGDDEEEEPIARTLPD